MQNTHTSIVPVAVRIAQYGHARRAFTLIELLVVISILAVLAALLIPVASRMMAESRTTKCLHFLRVIGNATMRYAGEHEMTLPKTTHQRRQGEKSWSITLQPYADGKVTFRCPDDKHKERAYSYVINDFLTPNPAGAPDLDFSRLTRLERANETVLFAEASEEYAKSDHFHFTNYRGAEIPEDTVRSQIAVERHSGAANYLFTDGHVEKLTWLRVFERLREPGDRILDPTAIDTANPQ